MKSDRQASPETLRSPGRAAKAPGSYKPPGATAVEVHFLFFGTEVLLDPPMFFTVPPTPTSRMARVALGISFCGTCRTFCDFRLSLNLCAACLRPDADPLRSTSVAVSRVAASKRRFLLKGTSVLPDLPAACDLALL